MRFTLVLYLQCWGYDVNPKHRKYSIFSESHEQNNEKDFKDLFVHTAQPNPSRGGVGSIE